MTIIRTTLLIATILLPLAASCSKKEAASCEQASAHAMSMIEAELARDGDAERLKTARANLPTLQNALLKACQVQEWDKASRQCILDAKTAAETKACEPGPGDKSPKPDRAEAER